MYPSLQWIDGESYTNPSCPQESVQEKFAIGHRVPLWKRSMDIFGSFIGLLILSPILLTTAALIKIVSPGPVFFKQERVGRFGKIFTLFKFRTMKVNNDAGEHREYLKELINGDSSEEKPMIKLADEARIIPMGKFIRSTCIDELPQLINVLIGDMSLIGPRPCIPYEAQEYLRWHERRFDIIPGMTGLWQVSGKNNTTFKGMIRLDIKYAAERSFLLDLKILFKTPIVVISQILGSFQKTKPATSAGRKRIDVKTAEMAVETAEVA
ncbi:MAG: sugar transferase [Candidatus Latescibacteria bacterium]|nr:sugar transferase [Candidatus Latescibacterota bacterium]